MNKSNPIDSFNRIEAYQYILALYISMDDLVGGMEIPHSASYIPSYTYSLYERQNRKLLRRRDIVIVVPVAVVIVVISAVGTTLL